jgi:hypothetical protein
MAQPTDLTGMLTAGLFEPTQKPIPSSYRESILGAAQQAGTGLRRGLGAMTGADTRTTAEVARAAMQGLDINNPAHQPKILEIVRKYAPEREAAMVAQFAQQGRARVEKEKAEATKQSTLLKEQQAKEGFADYIRKIDPTLAPLALSGKLTPDNMKDFLPELADKDRYKVVGSNIFDTVDSIFISGPQGSAKPKDNLITVDGRLYNALTKQFIDLPPKAAELTEQQRLYKAVKAANDAVGLTTPVFGKWLDRDKIADNKSPDKKIWDELKASNDAAGLPTMSYGDWWDSNNVETDTIERTDPITGYTSTSVINKKTGAVIRELGVTGLPQLEIESLKNGKYRVNNLTNGTRGELVDTPEAAQLRMKKMEKTQNELFALDQILAKTTKAKELAEGKGGVFSQGAAGTLGAYSVLSRLPFGTPSKELAGIITSLQANLGFDELQDMRKNSPTGGALGSVSNLEIGLLISAVTALDPGMGVEAFNEQLNLVREHYDNFKRSLMGVSSNVDYNSKEYASYLKTEDKPNNPLSVINGEFVLRDPETQGWFFTGVKVKETK